MYKSLISLDKDNVNFKDSVILKNFYKSVELYLNIIDNYSKLITKKLWEKLI